MAMEWFRMYHGMPFDTKLRVVAKRAGQPMGVAVVVWACVLDAASQHDPRGIAVIDPEEIAVSLDFDVEAIEAILAAMLDKGLLDEDGHLTAWDKRQHTTSTERSKKSRAKKKGDAAAGNTRQRGATGGNTAQRKNSKKSPDTDTDLDTDSEENTDREADSKKDSDKKIRAREEKKECEEEKQQSCGKDAEEKPDPKQMLQQMADIWNEEVQSKITPDQNAILTQKRKELLTLRWIDEFAEDIRAWRYFCEIIGRSEFCLGKIEGKDWTIDLTWAIQSSDRVAKILEGGFSGGKHPAKAPSCNLPEFADAWDDVIRRMEHHHGKPAIRSWFSNTVITAAEDTPDGALLTLTCPREFVRGWIENHYLTDLNHCWEEQSVCSRSVVGVQLAIKEETS
ncbi:MAG: hypothetical protein MK052_11685 [Alphaproteobacteria bacterium]|nr:hypothetical protein [Alphaproteobacteria bacterium]